MPNYCLYYFRKAQLLRFVFAQTIQNYLSELYWVFSLASRRPNDSRMIVALGEAYRKLYRLQEAKKCFWKAQVLGDMEGIALVKLAKYFKQFGWLPTSRSLFITFFKTLRAAE